MLAGLAEAGIDLAAADLVVGTSAGSVVSAQILGGLTLEGLYARQLEDPTGCPTRWRRAARWRWCGCRSRSAGVATSTACARRER